MFCPNCGSKTGEGARFCASCGYKLDAPMPQSMQMPKSPTTKFVPAKCTNCGGSLEVDSSKDAAICKYCNTPFIVDKAIQNFTVNASGTVSVGSATINVGGINIENYLIRAEDFIKKGQVDEGLKYYEDVLDIDFKNSAARKGITDVYLVRFENALRMRKFILAKTILKELKKTGYCNDKTLIAMKEQKYCDLAEKPLFDEPIYDGVLDTKGKGRLQISRTAVSVVRKNGEIEKYDFDDWFAYEPEVTLNTLQVIRGSEKQSYMFPGLMDGRRRAKDALEIIRKIKEGY